MNGIARLNTLGQSPWYDNLTRTLLRDGGLEALVRDDGIRGVTSNPTIFEKAMAAGEGYDDQLLEQHRSGASTEDAFWALVVDDIAAAAVLLRPVYDATDGDDGYVSVEVSPRLAHDTAGTIAQAIELYGRVHHPNVMIKIPATLAGLPAITEVIAAGINVNVTLIFDLDRYDAVLDAHEAGLARLVESGGDPASIASVGSFFVSRVDTEVDKRLPEGHPLRGLPAVANARVAYERYLAHCATDSWAALEARGARRQRPLWASTSTKNPAYTSTLYVDELVGPETVNTLAPASIEALRNGEGDQRPGAIAEDFDGARRVLADLEAAGVPYPDVTATLEREGVGSFIASYDEVLATLARRTGQLTA
ncbi:MAG: transaldolase [Actinomycetes bacterium]